MHYYSLYKVCISLLRQQPEVEKFHCKNDFQHFIYCWYDDFAFSIQIAKLVSYGMYEFLMPNTNHTQKIFPQTGFLFNQIIGESLKIYRGVDFH